MEVGCHSEFPLQNDLHRHFHIFSRLHVQEIEWPWIQQGGAPSSSQTAYLHMFALFDNKCIHGRQLWL